MIDKLVKSSKDYKIIAAIIENARIPVSILAKKTKLSREVVQYRLRNLEKNLISGYQARINLKFFYDSIYTIYLNIQGLDRREVSNKLNKLNSIHWIGNTLGKWSYVVSFSVDKNNDLSKFLDSLFHEFENNEIESYILTQQLFEYKDTFAGLFEIKEVYTSQKDTKRVELDDIDMKIIKILRENARYSNSEIAEKLNLTRETIRLRIKFLEKENVILNYRAIIKPQILELQNYLVAIKCKDSSPKNLSKISSFIARFPKSSYVCITSGEINILSFISINTIKELDDFCLKIRKEFSSVISQIEVLPIIEVESQKY